MHTLFKARFVGLVCLSLLAVVLLSSETQAQFGRSGKTGVSAAIHSNEMEIRLPIWTGDVSVVTPSFAVNHESKTVTWYKVGLSVRFNTRSGKVVPYLGAHIAASTVREDAEVYSDNEHEGYTDVIFGPLFGGEYFLDEHFSFGVEARVNVTQEGDRTVVEYYYDPYYGYYYPYRITEKGHTLVNTSALVMATFYF